MRRPLIFVLLLLTAARLWGADLPDDWAFKPVRRVDVPAVSGTACTPIDAFLLHRLEAVKLRFTAPADKATLLRRVTFDLIGLPPTVEELEGFLADSSPNAFEKVVDRLLASPAHGERQALPWLDVARFAETDGFKADDRRPHAWRYRDFVIRSFNADKPFDRFVKEQVAGDELYPDDPNALIATAFLRHYPDEYNAVNLEQRRQEILNDITDTTAQAFLGITLGCAKCHDHKFDPIPQEDYYRVQAFFAGWKEVDVPIMPAAARRDYEKKLHDWDERTAEVRRQLDEIERPHREKFNQKRRGRFPDEYAKLLDIAPEKRTPFEQQIATMVAKQVYADDKAMFSGMKGAEKERWEALKQKLTDAGAKPMPPAVAMGFSDVGRDVAPTYLLQRGNWRRRGEEVKPGFLSAFDDRLAAVTPPADGRTTGRRTALANWIADEKNPLTARVLVNRIWMQHFGQGLVATPGDFGSQGEKPTHPELLDWLATDFVANGWSLKKLHRSMVLSDAYQQGTAANPAAAKIDPENDLLWRMNRRRLDGEALRDAVLSVVGVLNPKEAGPSVFPELPAEIKASASAWPVSPDRAERNRRSIYVYVKRNLRYPLFAAFDAPDRNETCSRRFTTTTAPQALMLLNENLYAELARQFADRIRSEVGHDRDAFVERAYLLALTRQSTNEERSAAERFLEAQSKKTSPSEALADFCHALLNLNEFVYVD